MVCKYANSPWTTVYTQVLQIQVIIIRKLNLRGTQSLNRLVILHDRANPIEHSLLRSVWSGVMKFLSSHRVARLPSFMNCIRSGVSFSDLRVLFLQTSAQILHPKQ